MKMLMPCRHFVTRDSECSKHKYCDITACMACGEIVKETSDPCECHNKPNGECPDGIQDRKDDNDFENYRDAILETRNDW